MEPQELAWLRKVAREQKKSVSSLLAEATRLMRQLTARRSLLKEVGDLAALTPKRIREIEREWKG